MSSGPKSGLQIKLETHLRQVANVARLNSTIGYEVEARFGRHLVNDDGTTRFDSSVLRPVWFRFKKMLMDLGLRSTRRSISTQIWSWGRDRDQATRKRTVDGVVTWEVKTKIAGTPIEDPDNWTRYSFASEERLPGQPKSLPDRSIIRSGTRYYFEWDSYTRIEISEIGTDNQASFEVEIEFVGAVTRLTQVGDWLQNVQNIRKIFLASREIYTRPELRDLNKALISKLVPTAVGIPKEDKEKALNSAATSDFFDRRVMTTARNIYRHDMLGGPEGMIRGKTRYTLTYKTMGGRKLLIIGPLGIWSIYTPYEYNKLSSKKFGRWTIIDVEQLIQQKAGRTPANYMDFLYMFEIIDALYIQDDDVRLEPLIERLERIEAYRDVGWAKQFFTPATIGVDMVLNGKSHWFFDTPEQMFAIVSSIYAAKRRYFRLTPDQRRSSYGAAGKVTSFDALINPELDDDPDDRRIAFKIDGLIFTPEGPYGQGKIAKWKPEKYLTLDLRVIRSSMGDYELYYAVRNPEFREGARIPKTLNEKFVGTRQYPFDPITMLDQHDTSMLEDNYGIVEFKYDAETSYLKPYLSRNEKDGPNNKDVIMDVWKDVNHPITLADMSGQTLMYYRRYHNEIKLGLHQFAKYDGAASPLTANIDIRNRSSSGLVLLDLGSGQGGDLGAKWFGYSLVIAVEPNFGDDPDRFPEFARRYQLQDRNHPEVVLIQAAGQDTEIILAWVNYLTKGQGVDVISMMDSLTFFWESPEDLHKLTQTIKSCLKKDGKFLWKVLDGELVYDKFRDPYDSHVNTDTLKFGPLDSQIEIRLLDEDRGQVEVIIPGFVGTQTEYLTRISDLRTMLAPDLILASEYRANDPDHFLTESLLEFSSLYSYGIFVRKTVLNQIVTGEPDMSRRIDLSQVKVADVGTSRLAAKSNLRSRPSTSQPSKSDQISPPAKTSQRSPPGSGATDSFTEEDLANLFDLDTSATTPAVRTRDFPHLTTPDTRERLDYSLNSWYTGDRPLDRLYVIDDGHCMIHAFLTGIYPPYQEGVYRVTDNFTYDNVTYEEGDVINDRETARILLAVRFRYDLSRFLLAKTSSRSETSRSTTSDLDPGLTAQNIPPQFGNEFTNWELINNSQLASRFLLQLAYSGQQIHNNEPLEDYGRQGFPIDYSMVGIYLLLNSRAYLGDETFHLLVQATGIDVALIGSLIDTDGSKSTALSHYYTRSLEEQNPCCIIMGAAGHYETLGFLDPDGNTQTVFFPGDPIYDQVRVNANYEKYNFYQVLDSTLRELRYTIADETWVICNKIAFRRTAAGRNISLSYNPLYHHLWVLSAAIQTGKYRPGDQVDGAEPSTDSPMESHIRMTAAAVAEQGLDEDGQLNEQGKEIVEINTSFIGKMRTGKIALEVNAQRKIVTYKVAQESARKKVFEILGL